MKKEETGQYGMLGCMLGCVLGMRMLGCVLGMFSLIWYIIGHVRLYEYSSGSWTQRRIDIDGEAPK